LRTSFWFRAYSRAADEIAQHAAVIDSPLDKGHVMLFSNNPFWRGQTSGSYLLVFNAILNFDTPTREGNWTRK